MNTCGDQRLRTMAFQIDPGRPPGETRPLENQVPDQENSHQKPLSGSINPHSMNDKGGTDCQALTETGRLSFWITQITGAKDIGENPDNVWFPNVQTRRELSRLKKEIEALQRKCEECHSKNPGAERGRISSVEKNG